MSSPLVLGALQFVVQSHFLIVLACFMASEPGELCQQLPRARLESRSSCTRYVADELTTEAGRPERNAFLENLKTGVYRRGKRLFQKPVR
jgi:hypothetical protein